MKQVRLYTWPHCPFCINAKRFLDDKSVVYADTNIYGDKDVHDQLKEATGQRTVPYIFIGDTFIGGYSELTELNRTGRLDELLMDDQA